MLKRVRDINWSDKKYIRAGFIPIVKQGNILFFGFGVENKVGAIGDFGGHYEPGVDRDVLDAAIREYREEALNVFGEVTRNNLQDYYVLEGTNTVEILLSVPPTIYKYTELFHEMVANIHEHEIQNVIWFSRRQLLTVIDSQEQVFSGSKIYYMLDRIKNTIHMNRDKI